MHGESDLEIKAKLMSRGLMMPGEFLAKKRRPRPAPSQAIKEVRRAGPPGPSGRQGARGGIAPDG
jgi:hypothetical protein